MHGEIRWCKWKVRLFWCILCVCCIFTRCTRASPNLRGRPGEGYTVPVLVGTPQQQFNVLVDTGSTNFAIAGAPHPNVDKFFHKNQSSTYKDLEQEVSLVYTQGKWSGELAHDVVYFPTLNSVPSVACDIAFITESQDFYMNGSDWQGILGLAYPAIARPSSDVKPWIDFLQRKNKDKTIAFSLTLCGPRRIGENKHYGTFEVLNNMLHPYRGVQTATVIREWFYEIVLTNMYVNGIVVPVDCEALNMNQAIVDSGTTNVRLPREVFNALTNMIISITSQKSNIIEEVIVMHHEQPFELLIGESKNISDKFWLEQQMACWAEPQKWTEMPTISIDIASSAYQYFRINLPPSSYIREVFANQEPKTCYKFAIEPSNTGTILGVIALEGFQVIFNRTARTVGFLKSDCGPNVTLEGPFFVNKTDENNLFNKCWRKAVVQISLLNIAAYIVCALLLLSSCIFVYVFGQRLKNKYFNYNNNETVVSMSHASLINEDP